MLEVTRVYMNSSDEVLRIDTIFMEPARNGIAGYVPLTSSTYRRIVEINKLYESTNRVVASITVTTDADNIDFDPSGSNNYLWCSWDAPPVRCNMSDLPRIGDTV